MDMCKKTKKRKNKKDKLLVRNLQHIISGFPANEHPVKKSKGGWLLWTRWKKDGYKPEGGSTKRGFKTGSLSDLDYERDKAGKGFKGSEGEYLKNRIREKV